MQELSLPWLSKPSLILSYVIAALSGAAATAIELLLDAFLQTSASGSQFLCAIMFAAWFGGCRHIEQKRPSLERNK
jgi:hypothetical protein